MPSILVIEDDPGIRALLLALLERRGYAVIMAENGREGVKQFLAHRPDLVLCDIVMPEMEGQETIMTLRRRAPHVGIIAMSGSLERGSLYLHTARMLGANAAIPKPFAEPQLLQTIEKVLAAQPAAGRSGPGDRG